MVNFVRCPISDCSSLRIRNGKGSRSFLAIEVIERVEFSVNNVIVGILYSRVTNKLDQR